MSTGVKITEHFAQRIASTVRRVEAMPSASAGGKIPVRFEETYRQGALAVALCKTSSAFAKGTTATLNVWHDGTPPSESQTSGETIDGVVNKYANIASGKFCSVAMHGNGHWYVIAAECS